MGTTEMGYKFCCENSMLGKALPVCTTTTTKQNSLLPRTITSKCGCSAPGSLFSKDAQQHKEGLALEPLEEKCQDQAVLKKN